MMTKININKAQIEALEKQKRVHLINSIGGFKCLALVGTCNSQAHTNSEFDVTGLTPEFKNNFFAPFVAESNIQLGIAFKEQIDISTNNTTIIIGEIIEIFIPESCYDHDGFVAIEKANSITSSGLDSYHKTYQLDRLSYAKPNLEITSLL